MIEIPIPIQYAPVSVEDSDMKEGSLLSTVVLYHVLSMAMTD